jgi:predicted alpha/beta hydrolase family esterase
MMAGREATVLIVPGLRDHVPQHWQTLLASRLPRARTVAPMGRSNLDCVERVEAIEEAAAKIDGPIIVVAHSGGVIATLHWARRTQRRLHGALLATSADFDQPRPEGYPSMETLQAVPVPRYTLPFRSIVAASRNDPLARYERIATLAPGAASWSTSARSDISILRPAMATGQPAMASSPSSLPRVCHRLPEIAPEHRRTMLMS